MKNHAQNTMIKVPCPRDPSQPTLNQYVLTVLSKCFHLNHLKQLQAFLLTLGHGQTHFYAFKLVRFCTVTLSNLDYARFIFNHLNSPNIYLYTAMITAYVSESHHESAFNLFKDMVRRGLPKPNHFIFPYILKSYPEVLDSRMVMHMETKQLQGNRPNRITVGSVLSACSTTGMLRLGKSIHCYIYRNSLGTDSCFGTNSFISNALIDMYGKCGNLDTARRIFDGTLEVSLTSWNSMINCFALHGQSEIAISIFEEMMQSGDVQPDAITFVGLLNACTHAGLIDRGRRYFEAMTVNYGIEPQIEHYGCLIDLLGRAGRFKEVMDVINGMRIEPDIVVWGSLLNGCKIHGQTELAEFAVKKLVEMDPNNGAYGVMLANIYVELGKWDEVQTVRKVLKDQNAHKTPGCSWIEVDGLVHQFYSADKTHPKSEEIYEALEAFA
ncbi:Pentatricopeptide repeat [Dillenia turbinata]|uniref:Pentatricopeptide repeat n=1 Tax=Dillenia turbinata TaxID=194707 RepID=A0AAN8VQ16_9MAGN